ncbi:MAG: glucose-6-phosphate dehydrogenase [Pseudomonadales bacterium]|jgi:glucose-6-phosphate 1-dehydrogenase
MSAQAFDLVIFGGGGDLSSRKLIPAMYRAFKEGMFSPESQLIITLRTQEEVSTIKDHILNKLIEFLKSDEYDVTSAQQFMTLVKPVVVDIAEANDSWLDLEALLDSNVERARVFYLAIPPTIFGFCCEQLDHFKLNHENSRVVVEKPLGYDAASANELHSKMALYFDESQTFRIDHYLGKEPVQNLMALRFGNTMFEHLWDAKTIDHVQISISEEVGVEGRANFYDAAGAARDMLQNHLLQLLCLVAMESPNTLNADDIRSEKVKVLKALRPIVDGDVDLHTVRGQYVAGQVNGSMVRGYLEELDDNSTTETFVAVRSFIDNWRWSKVPFYLRTGKRLARRCAEIVIQYKDVSHNVFPNSSEKPRANRLVIRLQPEEKIQLHVMTKKLDCQDMTLKPVTLDLNLADTYDAVYSDSYKRLILDAANNNASLFVHREEATAAWSWVDPIIEHWRTSGTPSLYRSGSWGPDASDRLLTADGRRWFNVGTNEEA